MDPSNLNRWCARGLTHEAAALAFMREGPNDIRPGLLLLFHAQTCSELDAILLHGTAYLRAWCAARGVTHPRSTLAIAAGDALAVIWRRRAPHPVSARSRQLGIRNQTYYDLRTAAMWMYQARLHEARIRFITGTTYTRQSVDWKVGSSPPRVSSRAAPGKAQQPLSRRAA